MRGVTTRVAAVALVIALASSCDETPAGTANAAPTWPAGAVIAIDGEPILAADVDAASVFVQRIEPGASSAQLRRLALANVALPRTLAKLEAPEKRAQALAEAETAHAALLAGTYASPPRPDGLAGERVSGGFGQLGLVTWGTALDLPEGAWSGVLEEVGYFAIVRRLSRTEGPVPMATLVELDALVFPWLERESAAQTIEAAHDRRRMTIVDPAWRAIVPELLQHRMKVERP